MKPPFENGFAVDIDLSTVGVEQASALMIEKRYTKPSVIWCTAYDLGDAQRIITSFPVGHYGREMVAIVDPTYEEYWWSVGTHVDKGFGSPGA